MGGSHFDMSLRMRGNKGGGVKSATMLINTTYEELVALRDSDSLVEGCLYRITDYTCTCDTEDYDTQVAGHDYDIICLALSSSVLSEECHAIQHEGDTYFANSNLNAWKVWYCLDNNKDRFFWADENDGKGVVWRLIDEWDNDVSYDFKNIQFYRNFDDVENYYYTFWKTDDDNIIDDSLVVNVIYSTGAFRNHLFGGSNFDNVFGESCSSNTFGDYCYSNTFGNNCYSNAFGDGCYSNTFGDECNSNTFGHDCGYNTFGNSCSSNTFGNNFDHNTFGNNCYSNIFGDDCDANTFGDDCYGNAFGDECDSNAFGDEFNSNAFGDGCYSNTFGDECNSNTFGNYCDDNTFGDECNSNTFGHDCGYNTFGNSCSSNKFGDECNSNAFGDGCTSNKFGNYCDDNTFGNYCYCNTFGDGCYYNEFDDTKKYNNCHVCCGVNYVTFEFTEYTEDELNYEQYCAYDSSGVIKYWTPADLVLSGNLNPLF